MADAEAPANARTGWTVPHVPTCRGGRLRFALHKLLLSSRRPLAEQTKSNKDRAQAAELVEFLAAERPDAVGTALARLRASFPSAVRFVRQAAERLADGPGKALVLREAGAK